MTPTPDLRADRISYERQGEWSSWIHAGVDHFKLKQVIADEIRAALEDDRDEIRRVVMDLLADVLFEAHPRSGGPLDRFLDWFDGRRVAQKERQA